MKNTPTSLFFVAFKIEAAKLVAMLELLTEETTELTFKAIGTEVVTTMPLPKILLPKIPTIFDPGPGSIGFTVLEHVRAVNNGEEFTTDSVEKFLIAKGIKASNASSNINHIRAGTKLIERIGKGRYRRTNVI